MFWVFVNLLEVIFEIFCCQSSSEWVSGWTVGRNEDYFGKNSIFRPKIISFRLQPKLLRKMNSTPIFLPTYQFWGQISSLTSHIRCRPAQNGVWWGVLKHMCRLRKKWITTHRFCGQIKKLWVLSDSTAEFTVDDPKWPSDTNTVSRKSQIIISVGDLTAGFGFCRTTASPSQASHRPTTHPNFGLPWVLLMKFGESMYFWS